MSEHSSASDIPCPMLTDQLTVEAWVHATDERPEALQALVSKWTPLPTFDTFDAFDAAGTDGLDSTGYFGAVFDGRHVYFVPLSDKLAVRYDTHGGFQDARSWQAFDGKEYRSQAGRPGVHGVILRHNTLGTNGSFSLRYCDYGHNGGLNAAVPGPSFLVNTDRSARSVAAHRCLKPGRHHLAGVYDRRKLRLFIDGELAAQRAASGRLINNSEPVIIGRIHNGTTQFRGTVEDARITTTPRA